MQQFWDSLSQDAKGYIVGAIVTTFGVFINVLALWGIEGFRAGARRKDAQAAWDRERSARLEELRRETYVRVMRACEARAFVDETPADERPRVESEWMAAAGSVRLVTDDRDLIDRADHFIALSTNAEKEFEDWRSARTEFVKRCRAELGLAELDIKTSDHIP